jgi:Mg-chelatase subunit ChlD
MRFAFSTPPLIALVCIAGIFFFGTILFGGLRGGGKLVRFYPISRRRAIRRNAAATNIVSGSLLVIAFAAMGCALLGPEWGKKKTERPYTGRDIMLCIDISNSMTARDVTPGRLELARLFVRNVLSAAEESSIGVTIFKGNGVLAVPLTRDRTAVNSFIDGMNPGYSTVPGTNVEKGLAAAAAGFPSERPGKGYIFLISDGEGLEGSPLGPEIRRELQGLEVWTFLTGTEAGTPIRGEGDRNILTSADPGLLKDIAEQYNGKYFNLSDTGWWTDFTAVFGKVGAAADYGYVPVQRYPLFISVGVVLCFVYIFIRSLAWKK